MEQPPAIDEYLAVATVILDVPIEQLIHSVNIPLAESALNAPYATFGGHVFYPDPVQRAAILASRITNNHALPDGNKRTGLLMMLLELERCGATWNGPSQDEIAETFEQLAAGSLPEARFVEWVQAHAA